MVDFKFNIRTLFPQPIVKIACSLLPHTFCGDLEQASEAASKVAEIINVFGELSAKAQNLKSPITTAQKLRESDNQVVYLMTDIDDGHNVSVVGMLKIGKKDLYLLDNLNQTHKVEKTPCILDFYVHESRQRAGLGKMLFQTMLNEEKWNPVKIAVDRPSGKLLSFLKKHYGLQRAIPQAYNFVIFDGFFESDTSTNATGEQKKRNSNVLKTSNSELINSNYIKDNYKNRPVVQQTRDDSIIGESVSKIEPRGACGESLPIYSMAEIIEHSRFQRMKPLNN